VRFTLRPCGCQISERITSRPLCFPLSQPSLRPESPTILRYFGEQNRWQSAAATRQIGWYGRGTFNDYQTEYHSMVRRLQFERVLHGLRAIMFASANEILRHAGEEIGFQVRLSPSGLPKLDDINEAESLLTKGEISAKALLERFSLY
jgi:hypothetical protein